VTTTEGSTPDRAEADAGIHRMRFAVHPFSGHPQAQRRWTQMGHIQRSRDLLESEAPQMTEYVAAGAETQREAELVAATFDAYKHLSAKREDLFYSQQFGARRFLWSTAFEEDDWNDLRAKARAAFAALSEGKPPIIET
jgi:hypothetical protein